MTRRMQTSLRALHKSGASKEAVASYRQALEINPDSLNALRGLAEALNHAGHLDEIADLESFIVRCLNSPEIASRLVRSASQSVLKPKLEGFRDTTAVDPDHLARLDPRRMGF